MNNAPANLRLTAYTALFTALIIIGSYLSLPIGPVPIALADFFVMLTGLFLRVKQGLASVGLFIFLGVLGLPVFTGGKAGLAVLFGPTAGFLPGYLAMTCIVGLLSKGKISFRKIAIALIAGNIALYICGVSGLKMQMNLPWSAAIAGGLLPFVPGIIIKIGAAVTLTQMLLPKFRLAMSPAELSTDDLQTYDLLTDDPQIGKPSTGGPQADGLRTGNLRTNDLPVENLRKDEMGA